MPMSVDRETDPTIMNRMLTGTRPNSRAQRAPFGGYHEWPANARPHIQAKHIDGPMLVFRNGEVQWLTLWERLRFALGLEDADTLERKHRPWLQDPPCAEPLCAVPPTVWLDGCGLYCWEHYTATARKVGEAGTAKSEEPNG